MTSSHNDPITPRAFSLEVHEDRIHLQLDDGRGLSVPLVWFPRLVHGTKAERANWRWTNGGSGIHWPDLGEDISIAHLLAGHRSRESDKSLKTWLNSRNP